MSVLDRVRSRSATRSRPAGRPRRGTRPDRTRQSAATPTPEPTGDGVPFTVALLAGVKAAVLSLVLVAMPLLLAWAVSPTTTASWGQAARLATQGWLLLHGTSLALPGGASVGLTPLGLALVPVLTLWWAGRRVAAEAAAGARAVLVAAGWAVLGSTAVVTAAAVLTGSDAGRPVVWRAALGSLVLGALAVGAGALRCRPATAAALADRVPPTLQRAVRPALLAAALPVLVAAVLVTLSLGLHLDRVVELHRALAPGVVGGVVLVLAQVGVVPNLVLWAVSWLSGAGFAVGAGTAITPAASTLGLLPLVPVLGGLPEPGTLPVWCVVAPLVPVVAGVFAGWRAAATAVDAGAVGWRPAVTDALVAATLAAGLLTGLLAVSGGPAGPGRMAVLGPSPWRAGLVLLGELAVGAAVAAWLRSRRPGR